MTDAAALWPVYTEREPELDRGGTPGDFPRDLLFLKWFSARKPQSVLH